MAGSRNDPFVFTDSDEEGERPQERKVIRQRPRAMSESSDIDMGVDDSDENKPTKEEILMATNSKRKWMSTYDPKMPDPQKEPRDYVSYEKEYGEFWDAIKEAKVYKWHEKPWAAAETKAAAKHAWPFIDDLLRKKILRSQEDVASGRREKTKIPSQRVTNLVLLARTEDLLEVSTVDRDEDMKRWHGEYENALDRQHPLREPPTLKVTFCKKYPGLGLLSLYDGHHRVLAFNAARVQVCPVKLDVYTDILDIVRPDKNARWVKLDREAFAGDEFGSINRDSYCVADILSLFQVRYVPPST